MVESTVSRSSVEFTARLTWPNACSSWTESAVDLCAHAIRRVVGHFQSRSPLRHVRHCRPQEGLRSMRSVFKTSYYQDFGLFRNRAQRDWYLVLMLGLLSMPFLLPAYLVDFSLVLIFGLCGLLLMVLV